MKQIEAHQTALVFCNTRGLCELIFQDLWTVNEHALPIGIHHGSLSIEARRKVEAAMASGKLRGLVCTSSLDLASTGATSTSSSRWARPRAPRACSSASAAPTTGSTSRRRRSSSPATASNIWRRAPAFDAIEEGALDPDGFRPARSTCSPSM
jgi:ATP-dependent Lhr-like helicase